MTEKDTVRGRALADGLFKGETGLEIRHTRNRSELTLCGVVSVQVIEDGCIRLATHGGAVSVYGSRLLLSVFEERTVRIYGRIVSVELGYGRT
jgi:hypothetical protein